MNRRSGLSLLELLLALALLAVIGAALVSTVGLGIRLNDRVTGLAERQEPLAARRLLRSLLIAALPPDRIAPFEHGFVGDEDGFSFVTLNGRNLAPGAAALRIAVARQSNSLTLQIWAMMDDSAEVVVLDLALTEGAGLQTFSYFDPRPDVLGWEGSWSDPERLPGLIRIEAAPDGQRIWPEFTVAPALGP